MPKYRQGIFKPRNPNKYVGKGSIQMRSSWEFKVAQFLDTNPAILEWASEGLRIPYIHPFTHKKTTYVPDFTVKYKDKNGKIHVEILEVKPYKQSVIEGKMNQKQRATVAVNHQKWAAAVRFCKANGIKFRVITENEIFRQ